MLTKRNTLSFVFLLMGFWLVAQGVPNGSFENGITNWTPITPGGAQLTFETLSGGARGLRGNRQAKIDLIDQGDNSRAALRNIGIQSDPIRVTGGQQYDFKIHLEAEEAGKRFQFMVNYLSSDTLSAEGRGRGRVIVTTETYTEYTQVITIPTTTSQGNPVRYVRVLLGVGDNTGVLFLDNFTINRHITDEDGDGFNVNIDCDDTDPFINPDATEILDNEVDENCDGILGLTDLFGNLIPNFGFEEGTLNWSTNVARDAEVGFSVFSTNDAPEGKRNANVIVSDQGTNNASQSAILGLISTYFPVQAGKLHHFSIDLKASPQKQDTTGNKTFQLTVFTDDGSRSGFHGLVQSDIVQITDEWTTYEFTIEIPATTFTRRPVEAARVILGLGASLGRYQIDNVRLQIDKTATDRDNDGFTLISDCDDTNPDVFPGAAEIPDNDVDENCDGIRLYLDKDGDGYTADVDCNDADPSIHPDVVDIPNNDIDEDCDGIVFMIDEDGDGANSDIDCDDTNPNISPLLDEIPNNEVDENCDGIAEVTDKDEDGFHAGEDCDDEDPGINPNAVDIRNNHIDEDCDGTDATFFDDYAFLDGIIDRNDCEGASIEFYRSAQGQFFIFVKTAELQKLIHESGEVICLEHPLIPCLVFAGLRPSDLVEVWECSTNTGRIANPSEVQLRAANNQSATSKTMVYPTIVRDLIHIESEQEAIIKLINITGQVVKTMPHQAGTSSMNVSEFKTGYYMISVTKGAKTEAFKVVITK